MEEKIVAWIKKQVESTGAKGCVLGLSGGVDSSVAAVLCKQAFPKNVLGIIMPCFSIQKDIRHAEDVAKKFSIPTELIDLSPILKLLYLQLEGKNYSTKKDMNKAIANLKPRLRMISLYYYANKLNYLVIGTGNKSEITMGYFTKYGDAGVDLLPLGGLLKSEVFEMAARLDIPQHIIEKPPSAGLWEGQTDEEEMGITYVELDKIITGLEKGEERKLDPKLAKKVKTAIEKTAHKKALPPVYLP